jgi:hypothetical protein
VELQATKTYLDTRTGNFQETLEIIGPDFFTDLAVLDLGAKATRKKTLAQQRHTEGKTGANKLEFQTQWEEVKAVAERGSSPAACACAAQPSTFNSNTSWAVLWCWSHVAGPFPRGDQGNRYLLIAIDYFTKWPEVHAIPNQESSTVEEAVVTNFFLRFRIPLELHSDQGHNFEFRLLQEL